MSAVARVTITLTTEMAQAIKGAVAAGEYASSSEIIREALRDWQHKRALLAQELESLRADIRASMDDIEAGRIHDFDAERIVQKGRQRFDPVPSE